MSPRGDGVELLKGQGNRAKKKKCPKAGEPGQGARFLKGWVYRRDARRAAGVAAGHAQRSDGGGGTGQLPPRLSPEEKALCVPQPGVFREKGERFPGDHRRR